MDKRLKYEGKAKRVYEISEEDVYLVEFKDDATAFNGKKKGSIQGKGVINAKVSAHFFKLLEEQGVPTHFIEMVDDNSMKVKAVEIIPVEVVVRNIAAGSLAKRLGLEEGIHLKKPVLEFYYKSDELGDPMINIYHIRAMEFAKDEEMQKIEELSFKINDILADYLEKRDILLVDFKLEFGRYKGKVILADEISPDTCRFWDSKTKEKLDKDRFRRDLGGVEEAYQEVLKRVTEGGC